MIICQIFFLEKLSILDKVRKSAPPNFEPQVTEIFRAMSLSLEGEANQVINNANESVLNQQEKKRLSLDGIFDTLHILFLIMKQCSRQLSGFIQIVHQNTTEILKNAPRAGKPQQIVIERKVIFLSYLLLQIYLYFIYFYYYFD